MKFQTNRPIITNNVRCRESKSSDYDVLHQRWDKRSRWQMRTDKGLLLLSSNDLLSYSPEYNDLFNFHHFLRWKRKIFFRRKDNDNRHRIDCLLFLSLSLINLTSPAVYMRIWISEEEEKSTFDELSKKEFWFDHNEDLINIILKMMTAIRVVVVVVVVFSSFSTDRYQIIALKDLSFCDFVFFDKWDDVETGFLFRHWRLSRNTTIDHHVLTHLRLKHSRLVKWHIRRTKKKKNNITISCCFRLERR